MLCMSLLRVGFGFIWLLRWSAKEDTGKKGINMWACIGPTLLGVYPILEYRRCARIHQAPTVKQAACHVCANPD